MPRLQIESFVEALPMPALFVDQKERILASNALVKKVLGDGLAGRHYINALRQPAVIEAIENCAALHTDQTARYLGNDGTSDTTFRVHAAFVHEDFQGVLVTLIDITDIEKTEELRSDFVANVSHELRTPLTAVLGFIETLQGPAKDDRAASERFLGIMAAETERMNRLVDDLLSLSRLEGQRRSRPTELVRLDALLSSVEDAMGSLAANSKADLKFSLDDTQSKLRADGDQLRQVFTNLIENALKYGGEGVSVVVILQAPAFEPRLRSDGIRVIIRDNGAGFDPVHIPRLTERFYRIDSHRSREMGGTGLGLAIVKHIINRHRGRLEIKSEQGQGSEFTVILPIEARVSAK
ncbi:ATP-binding protein [Planktotalea sp.]|uniref:ATP-binding protein n=1 Tax=Planktotalea sp. TaxID=2029877 RepID=UPI003D6AB38A